MTMMTTIIAVALGLTPVQRDGIVQPISSQDANMIGSYSETVDDTGTTHLRGVNRSTGEIFHITVNPHGRVAGSVGDTIVTFNVRPAS